MTRSENVKVSFIPGPLRDWEPAASISVIPTSVFSAYFDAWGIYLGHPYFRVFCVFRRPPHLRSIVGRLFFARW